VFNQSVVLSAICGVLTLAAGFLLSGAFRAIGGGRPGRRRRRRGLPLLVHAGTRAAVRAGGDGSALRGTGIVQPTMIVQMLTVILNTVLAPVLNRRLGHASPARHGGRRTCQQHLGGLRVLFLWIYFLRLEHYVGLRTDQWSPRLAVIRRILNVGLPAGGEFFMIFVILGVIYWVDPRLRTAAQAGFGVGARVMQALFLPVMAIAFAASPVAGQNFGARHYARVRETFRTAALLGSVLMLAITLLWPVARGVVHRMLHAPGGRGGGRRDLPAHHLLELRSRRDSLYLSGLFRRSATPGRHC